MATGTVEEKIFQRQLSKEGLQSVVDDKEQVNALSSKDLRNLFKLRSETPSDTHDKLRCERCRIIADRADAEEQTVLPQKLEACRELLRKMMELPESAAFCTPIKPEDHDVESKDYERLVRSPIDLGMILQKLDHPQGHAQAYTSASGFSKDINKVFTNVLKVWPEKSELGGQASHIQEWWRNEWAGLVPVLMAMKNSNDNDGQHACDERGEAFQDQIGMPDEEDMRSWSHHHGVESVDDPVFRAALQGTDAVSFVFALEVTWNLIQQRQQEEDERRAMKELECLKDDEENAENDSGADVDNDNNNKDEQSSNAESEGSETESNKRPESVDDEEGSAGVEEASQNSGDDDEEVEEDDDDDEEEDDNDEEVEEDDDDDDDEAEEEDDDDDDEEDTTQSSDVSETE